MTLRLIEDFFEVGANPENISGSNWNVNGGRVSNSGAIGSNGTGTWVALAGQGWNAGISDFYASFALRAGTNMSSTNILRVYSDNNTTQHLSLSMDANNRLVVYRGSVSSGVVLGTSSVPFSILGHWRSINVYFKIDDAAGRAVVRVDGSTQIDFTGDTRNGGSSTDIDALRFDLPSGSTNGIADLVVCDGLGSVNNTYPGDIACIRRLPNANGVYAEFTGTDGNSTDNYQLVDEAPSNDSDYTYATEPGKRDSYGIQDMPVSTVSIMGVRAVAKTAKSGAGAAGMSILLRENGVDTYSTSMPLSTSFAWQADTIRETKPSDSTAWSISDVNNMEIGVRSESS